ncbi:hypothetical protein VTK73DRAFT_7888 [Phialemonium thermophilum]|uniref:Zn(2)-C6 fungal-type domain-containing protein n=1 Tax=Phialemonium thermophilum TaxID=223376 RepID=A0ABR3XSP5_9PEZI
MLQGGGGGRGASERTASEDGADGDHKIREKRRRHRVPVSCFSCRALKTKCDGVRPTCATCAHSGRTCAYLQQGISGSGRMSDTVVISEIPRTTSRGPGEGWFDGCAGVSASLGAPSERQDSVMEGAQPSSYEGALGESPASVVADANVSLGGVAFAQLILNALHGHDNIKAQSMSTDNEVREKPAQLGEDDLYSMPANAMELLDQFFHLRHPLSPVFHVPTVRPVFETAIRARPQNRTAYKTTLIVLHMIFALCTSHWLIVSEDTVANHRAARRHYDIAMRLLQPNMLRDWNLEHVQALLIGARYLQSSSCAGECWNVLGLAIRIAYGLCLHRDPPDTDPPPLRETKRRVWYAAYTLDRLMSMVYERPAAIRSSECSVQLPEDLDDACIRTDGVMYPMPRRSSPMTFSIEVIKLYRIMEALMTSLAAGDVHNRRKLAHLVTSLDETYRRWHRALPACLVLDHSRPQEQPWILALRGNMVRILIHRQSLAVTLHDLAAPHEAEDAVIAKTLRESRSVCISAAIETVDIVALRHEETKKTLGLNWFNIYYLFNAVIVLVSHLADPLHSNDRVALAKVELALHMIQTMSRNHAFAARAHSFLQKVLNYTYQSAAQRQANRDEGMVGNVFSSQTTEMPTEMQYDAALLANVRPFMNLPDDISGSLEYYQGRDPRDQTAALAPWSFNDQWFY